MIAGPAAAQQGPGERAVVAAGAVPQMDRRGVGGTAPHPGQAVETAPRADRDDAGGAVAQHDIQARVIAACQPQDRVTAKQAPGRGISPGGYAGASPVCDINHARIGQVAVGAGDG